MSSLARPLRGLAVRTSPENSRRFEFR
jgi:hypothetical protein